MKHLGCQQSYQIIKFWFAFLIALSFLLYPPLLKADSDIEVEGPIQSIGTDSLVVTGITFFVDANTEVNGPNGPINFSSLMVGHFVEVEAELQPNGTYLATEIELDDDIEVEGFIQAIGPDSLVVMGVIFFVDANTEIRGPHGSTISFSDLQVGDFVEVEADLQPNATYLATRIELEDEVQELEVEGIIETIGSDSLVVTGMVFFVDSNTVIVDDDNDPIAFSDLQVGDFVEVKASLQPNGNFLATRIELEDEAQKIEVEGMIEVLGSDSLVVSGIVFFVDANTEIRGPHGTTISFSDLQVGDFVEVRAELQPGGTFLATRIKLEDEDQEIEVEGVIEAIGSDSLIVSGIVFIVDSNTVIVDDDNNPIAFSDLQVGDFVEVKARIQPNGRLLAVRIKLEDDFEDEIEITAPIDTLFNDTIVVAGITFWTDPSTEILDDDGQPISFSDLQIGMIVEIRGEIQPDGSIYATKIKVEDFFQQEIEVEGFIDSLGTDHLIVLGITFHVDANTRILDRNNQPIQFSDLSVGLKVEVRARQQANGTLLANRIKVKNPNNELELHAVIDSLGASSVFASGLEFLVNSNTLILDPFNNPISFTDLTVGLFVEIKALLQPNGSLLTTRIKIEDSPNFSVVTGMVTAVSPGSIVISQPQYQVTSGTIVLNSHYQPIDYSQISIGQNVTLWSDGSSGAMPTALQIKMNGQGNTTGLEDKSNLIVPEQFTLGQNYPNPFNPRTTIPLSINSQQWQNVELHVYNILGQKIRTIFSGLLNAGSYEFTWDGTDQRGTQVSSGVYFYQLTVDRNPVSIKRMILLK